LRTLYIPTSFIKKNKTRSSENVGYIIFGALTSFKVIATVFLFFSFPKKMFKKLHFKQLILRQPVKFHANWTTRGGNLTQYQFSNRRSSAMLSLM